MKIGEEYPIEDEEVYINKIVERFKQTLSIYYKPGEFKRMFHPKMHGLVLADFIIEKNLPPELRVGVFEEETTYPAWIRLSNAKRHPSKDKKKDMRGMAIKLVGVHGKKLQKHEEYALTQDFLLVTSETLQTKTVRDFQISIQALTGNIFTLLYYVITHPKVALKSLKQISKCSNLLEEKYFSMTPYKLGPDNAVKYAAFPHKSATTPFPSNPKPDFLREQLVKDLSENEYCFDFMVQLQTDPVTMPIEDPTVPWNSPFIKVATIRIKKQVFDLPSQNYYCETLSFSPWHSLPEHRPLGGVNRARKLVYEEIASYRRLLNNVILPEEPEKIEKFK